MRDAVPGMAPAAPSCPLNRSEAALALALQLVGLILLHGPGGQYIYLNPSEITSLRVPRGDEGHISGEVHCIVNTADGKFSAVIESCTVVDKMVH